MSPNFLHGVRASSTGHKMSVKKRLKAKLWSQAGCSVPTPPLTV